MKHDKVRCFMVLFIVHGRGPSNIYLGIFFAPLMFAGIHNQSNLLAMVRGISNLEIMR